MLAQRLTSERVPVFEFRANIQNFSEPTKELDAAMRTGRIEHDGNPVLEWSISNVVGRYDVRSNVYPRRVRPEQKIDPAVALIMAVARCMAAKPFMSVYETRVLSFECCRASAACSLKEETPGCRTTHRICRIA